MPFRAEAFDDRRDAGIALAQRLRREPLMSTTKSDGRDVVVIGLARGGVPVAREVADAFDAALDVLVVRKIGAPGQPEFAMGAIAAGEIVVNDDVPRRLGVSEARFAEAVDRENRLRIEREQRYREGREPLSFTDRTVVLVDDGLATGSTMAVAVRAARAGGAAAIVVAVPTGPADTLRRFADDPGVDAVVAVMTPEPFHAVGQSYRTFGQVDDDHVRRSLRRE
ncbi:phosphoribosyltransferase family protein [Gordonia sp. ABSL11-1]|uniref:phosphoribosyltransferase n=1 Tax=Gordonia sp. ABSL11-1 TaxID=3053924 RepID=UPI0025743B42|nr:phosphoribosyltransferase family protein [Gordonia sp. ABSL11-1]MDL9946295.1 phosphoribosyltransferase family protein [Gordonia sp. ABSL11-1]